MLLLEAFGFLSGVRASRPGPGLFSRAMRRAILAPMGVRFTVAFARRGALAGCFAGRDVDMLGAGGRLRDARLEFRGNIAGDFEFGFVVENANGADVAFRDAALPANFGDQPLRIGFL